MKFSRFLLVALITAIIGIQCSEDESPGSMIFELGHEVAGTDLVTDQMIYNSRAGHPYSVIRLKYYISNFSFVNTDGTSYDTKIVHYYEHGQPATYSLQIDNIPAGEYTTLNFIYGLDEEINQDGALPNTTTNINMEWPLPGDQGYHYMKFEGKYDSYGSGVVKNYNLHTGATGGNQNYIRISLPLGSLNIDGGITTVKIMMDLNEWMQNPVTYDFETFGPMIMANQDAQEILKANGSTVFRITSIE